MIIGPRNFTTKKVKLGHTDAVLFSKPSYVSTGKYEFKCVSVMIPIIRVSAELCNADNINSLLSLSDKTHPLTLDWALTFFSGDVFKEAAACVLRTEVHDGHVKAGHEKAFKLARVKPDLPFKVPYEHMSDFTEKKKNYRDEDGHVIISPRNFLTNPPKKGKTTKKTTFEPFPAHVVDDYNNPRKVAL